MVQNLFILSSLLTKGIEKLTVGWTRLIDPYLKVTDFGIRLL